MLPTELWILIAQYMKNKELYYLSLCSKDTYLSIKDVLNIRRLAEKFVNQCALSYLTCKKDFYTDEYFQPEWVKQYPSTVCISEYHMTINDVFLTYPWFVNRYVKSHWDLYFIPWQLGSRGERELYLESHPEYDRTNNFDAILSETFEDQLFDFHLSLRKIKINIENMKSGRPINKAYPYCQKAEPGVTEKDGYIKQYRHPDHTICSQCNLMCSSLEIQVINTSYKLNGRYMPREEALAICNECFETNNIDYEVDLFD